jgi:hypothetical protein
MSEFKSKGKSKSKGKGSGPGRPLHTFDGLQDLLWE